MVSTSVETGIEDYYVNEWQDMYKIQLCRGTYKDMLYMDASSFLEHKTSSNINSTYLRSSRLQFPEMSTFAEYYQTSIVEEKPFV